MTVSDAIKRALRLLGVIDSYTSIDQQQLADGLVALNGFIGSVSTGRNAVYAPTSVTHTLSIGTPSYTIGSGGTIDTTRPNRVINAFVRDSASLDYDVKVVANEDYQRKSLKSLQGIPESLYLAPSFPLSTIYLYPSPNLAYALHLELWAPLPTYSTVTASLGLPPEYDDMICYNLATRLAPEYSMNASPTVAAIAIETLNNIKKLNSQPVPMIYTDPFKTRRTYDIYGDI